MQPHIRRIALALIAGSLLVSVGSVGALAQDQAGGADDEIRIVDEEITIRDGLLTVGGTTLRGPGLPDTHVDERKVVLESSTLRFDGFHVNAFEKDITICRIVIHFEDVGFLVKDLTLEGTGQ